MAANNKILRHPDKEFIVEKLTSGVSIREMSEIMKKKYPKTPKYHISPATIQEFRKNYLKVSDETLDAIKQDAQKKENETAIEKKRAKIQSSTAYQQKLEEAMNDEIDVTKKLVQLEKLISSRIEYFFNSLDQGGSTREDRVMLEYMKQMQEVLRDWKKFVEGVADKTVEHNININVVNEQVNVLKGVVYEVLREMDPALIPVFIEKLNARLSQTHYNSQEYVNYKKIGVIDAE
jgi:cysteinyl-tRNA synthetase